MNACHQGLDYVYSSFIQVRRHVVQEIGENILCYMMKLISKKTGLSGLYTNAKHILPLKAIHLYPVSTVVCMECLPTRNDAVSIMSSFMVINYLLLITNSDK